MWIHPEITFDLLNVIDKIAPLIQQIFQDLNQRYFSGSVHATIRWGRYGHRPRWVRRRSIRLGAYFFKSRVIRIHPVLAQAWIPLQVLEMVIHHEMCHAAAPTVHQGPKRRHHHAEFRSLERQFEHHAWAKAWLKENLETMIRDPSLTIKLKENSKSIFL